MNAVVQQLPLTISEKDFQTTVTEYADLMHWTWCHFRPLADQKGRWRTALSGYAGMPDLVFARGGAVLLVELKRHGRHPEPAQKVWLRELGDNGRLWTPVNWNSGEIIHTLRHHGRD